MITADRIYHGSAADGKIPRELLIHSSWQQFLLYFESSDGSCGVLGIHRDIIQEWLVAVQRNPDGSIREYRMPTRFLRMMRPEELAAAISF